MKKTYLITIFTLSSMLAGVYGQCDQISPAERAIYGKNTTKQDMNAMDDGWDDMADDATMNKKKDSSMSKKKGYSYSDENMVYKSLSPKSQKVFKSLSKEDKQRVIDAYQNGGDPLKTITNILQEDKKNAKGMTNSKNPAPITDEDEDWDDDDMDGGSSTSRGSKGSRRSGGCCDMGCSAEESPAVKTMRKQHLNQAACDSENIFN